MRTIWPFRAREHNKTTTGSKPQSYSTMLIKELQEAASDPNLTEEESSAVKYELGARGALEVQVTDPESSGIVTAPPRPLISPTPRSSGGPFIFGCCLAPVALLVVTSWMVYALGYAPKHPEADQTLPGNCTLFQEVLMDFPNSWPRVELMGTSNVDIYMSRQDFEAVPFPDRSPAVKRVGEAWARYTDWYNFSSVRIRDVRTGDDLASYSCTTGSVTLEKKGWF